MKRFEMFDNFAMIFVIAYQFLEKCYFPFNIDNTNLINQGIVSGCLYLESASEGTSCNLDKQC